MVRYRYLLPAAEASRLLDLPNVFYLRVSLLTISPQRSSLLVTCLIISSVGLPLHPTTGPRV
jgi:hypothetical protein